MTEPAEAGPGGVPAQADPKDFRVSDAEREHVVNLLQKAIGRGLITLDEFTERTDTALAAKTRAQLNAVLLDLPGIVHRDRAAAPVERSELKTTMSSVTRKGHWTVPQRLVVRNRMGSADLDFREAAIPHAVVDIELDVTAGSVKLVLPDNATVNAEGVELAAGTLKDKVGIGVDGRPHFVVHGYVRAGTLEIKKKKPRWFKHA
ncbi:DUF1707 SHOCT-like domain-containing protein [Saccharothrix syringae]|uniref:DUF1707 domain-containing protein n=1 Tax=Saccharothrix syringae TaxID=103733 RepID=A0A5Q0HCI2_SACSY|nr:DUF1707 domain-containing protein [Saccharothrix syringae]QFZ23891.1 DUF1707 domain-containing protein [Saccharothrix syringae]